MIMPGAARELKNPGCNPEKEMLYRSCAYIDESLVPGLYSISFETSVGPLEYRILRCRIYRNK